MTARIDKGQWTRLDGPEGSGKSTLLLMLAGLEIVPKGRVSVSGKPPFAARSSEVVYIGRFSPMLKGTLRRNLSIGAKNQPDTKTLTELISVFGLEGLLERLGGLDGVIAEGGANLSRVEIARVLAARALVVEPKLLLVDADEMGMGHFELDQLAQRLKPVGCSAVIATYSDTPSALFDAHISIPSSVHSTEAGSALMT